MATVDMNSYVVMKSKLNRMTTDRDGFKESYYSTVKSVTNLESTVENRDEELACANNRINNLIADMDLLNEDLTRANERIDTKTELRKYDAMKIEQMDIAWNDEVSELKAKLADAEANNARLEKIIDKMIS